MKQITIDRLSNIASYCIGFSPIFIILLLIYVLGGETGKEVVIAMGVLAIGAVALIIASSIFFAFIAIFLMAACYFDPNDDSYLFKK